MAELIWKGKHAFHEDASSNQQTAISSITSLPQQLITYENHVEKAREIEDNTAPPHANDWYNRLILGDKTPVLAELLPEFSERVNLIYIDPPFMTGRDFTSGVHLAYSDRWNKDLDFYLQWLYETFSALYLLLDQTGSMYVHLDWRVAHYAKVILDEIFGYSANAKGPGFKNEIIWNYQSGGRGQKSFARKHDTLFLYTRSAEYCFHGERIGERRGTQKRNHMRKKITDDGHISWTIQSAGKLYSYDEDTPMTPQDVWSDISHLHQKDPERNGYATQKPEALLHRILLASSEEDDLVLDCFCGSGVTPIVAEQLGRRWIACDKSELAIQMTRQRLLAREHSQPFIIQRLVENEAPNSYDIIGRANN